jgi:sphinganine-1-phosphate aldolase
MASGELNTTGRTREQVLGEMRALRQGDANWREGKTWSLVYHAGEDVTGLLAEAYTMFMAENGLSPIAFPSLRRFEAEIGALTAKLFHGPEAAGSMTSGGSESVLMAVKTARDHARATRGIRTPQMVIPHSAHPAFDKAGHYFGVEIVHAPLGADFRVDVAAMERLITPDTILLVGSAPAYPHGVIDPITEIAALAQSRGILCHVDACLGGFLLPFAAKLGHAIPPFDFQVPGVTSISADLHKYGYAAKGASIVMYRDRALRQHQFFTRGDWPGGLYASPSMTGTRPGGAIAAAWAVLQYLGEEGYLAKAREVLATAGALMTGVRATPGLKILGEPGLTVFAFASDTLDVYALGDAMEARGWKLDRQQHPPSLHLMVTPAHTRVVEPFLNDLRACAASLTQGTPAPEGSAAMYGMAGAMPRGDLESFLGEFLGGLYEL